jgi:hypothetical protein
MTKKHRSPEKVHESPNPRPTRRNKKQREPMVKKKKQESPIGTPIHTPIQTPERQGTGNSFEVLRPDSDAEDQKSVDTITADDPNVEIESVISTNSTDQTKLSPTETAHGNNDGSLPRFETPDDFKQLPTGSGPIARILPTDNERLGTSIPLFASQLVNTATELFPEPAVQPKSLQSNVPTQSKAESQTDINRKASPVALHAQRSLSHAENRKLAEDTVGDEDSKSPVNVHQYNSAASFHPSISQYRQSVPNESKAETQIDYSRKPLSGASQPQNLLSKEEARELAADIFGDEDSKPPAKVNPYNSAARIPPNISQLRQGNFIQELQKEEIHKAVQQARMTFKPNQNPGLIFANQSSYPSKARQNTSTIDTNMEVEPLPDHTRDSPLKVNKQSASDMEIEPNIDAVERLNISIAQQKAQLEQLQSSLAALKSAPKNATQEYPSQAMDVDSFIPVVKKKNSPAPKEKVNQAVSIVTHGTRPPQDPLAE